MSPQVLGWSTPTARVEHRCQLCGRTVRKGERYDRQRIIGDDGPYVFKSCAHCQAVLKITDIMDWADDDYGYTMDTFDCWEPRSVADLRLKVGWRRNWERADGTLWDVPERAA